MLITPEIKAEIDQGALFVFNHSGGKDSQAMMIELLKVIPPRQILVAHASLGRFEWDGALELAEQQAREAGVHFLVARAKKSFLDMVFHRFRTKPTVPSFPSNSTRQCTSDLKRDPIAREVRRYMKAHGIKRVVSCMGLRAQESPNRAKKKVWQLHIRNSIAGRTWHEWLPIHQLSQEEVFAIIYAAGQLPHYAYLLGNERLSCVFCIFASVKDLINGARARPELYAEFCEAETITGYTMHQSRKSLIELTGIQPVTIRSAQPAHEKLAS
ncbi:phosphoadenosine phosphosulfate reductase [Alkanindiges hydrocarboniclasticus]|uniref:Phosphoadenosine phosphosulfate reductase n=1 Tax=Alkanindiges hydrocarboniclasticus TaxID=1907941 RepID=A0A1S8CSW7_9GAMM|nr:phosphoadenosine phosphosulfate reductase family protein [Alkanindiges hydrocarboniclasticus]ONG37953.1 phosphoadenosine phosphosulfate reductase [Alkanindiges hydrocarboniclasticus]